MMPRRYAEVQPMFPPAIYPAHLHVARRPHYTELRPTPSRITERHVEPIRVPPAITESERISGFWWRTVESVSLSLSDETVKWNSGVADYGHNQSDMVYPESGIKDIPDISGQRGYHLGGTNVSDDLLMFVSTKKAGLKPNKNYRILFRSVSFATNVRPGQIGVGGSPGESVSIKVGAYGLEPKVKLVNNDYSLNWDIGIQANDGPNGKRIGHFAKDTDTNTDRYAIKTIQTNASIKARTDRDGNLWVLLATDSGFEARSDIYFIHMDFEIQESIFNFSFLESPESLAIDPRDGRTQINSQTTYESMAQQDSVPGAPTAQTVKFLMTGVQNPEEARFYFMNTQTHQYHFYFARDALGYNRDGQAFNDETYFSDSRNNLAGSIVYYPNRTNSDGSEGTFTLQFFFSDPVTARFVIMAYKSIEALMPFAQGRLCYVPTSVTHTQKYKEEEQEYARNNIAVLSSEELLGNVPFVPLNPGKAYGILRVVEPTDPTPLSVRDVVIFKSAPNDLSHVAAVVTEEPQTPLSHINLKAIQNRTPNAYWKNASQQSSVQDLIGKPVYIDIGSEIEIREATLQEVQEHIDSLRPTNSQIPQRNLHTETIQSLDNVRNAQSNSVGAKAANVGELKHALSEQTAKVPDGFAVPFYFYDTFMKENGLYRQARQMIEEEQFSRDISYRDRRLKEFRRSIKAATMPSALSEALEQFRTSFPEGTSLRCRSSTNNEDLVGFNGAGLYDSFTHRIDEGLLEKSIKQVYASLWNFRAFEEREFYRIDHFVTAMGVLVHPNYDDERANGVAVTKNPFERYTGYYINVQFGEALVTNPDPGAVPEQLLVRKVRIRPNEVVTEVSYITHSSIGEEPGQKVLLEGQVKELADNLAAVQDHFRRIYRGGEGFAMDVEFKIDIDGELVIKQARPWVEHTPNTLERAPSSLPIPPVSLRSTPILDVSSSALVDRHEIVGEAGRTLYPQAAGWMFTTNLIQPAYRLTVYQKDKLRPYVGSLVDRVIIQYDCTMTDSLGCVRIPHNRPPFTRKVCLNSGSAGQTFGHRIYINKPRDERNLSQLALLCHELVHSMQFETYRSQLDNFGYHYFKGWSKADFSYRRNRLEKEAFKLQKRFIGDHSLMSR